MSEFSASEVDRRQSPRTRLVEIAYIGMGPENGGLVLDVSDGGLSFHAVAPVEKSQTIRFLLSLQGHSRVEGAGEVVWTNDTRTVCGLKFTSLSSDAREHLNNWTTQSRVPEPASPPDTISEADDPAVAPQSENEAVSADAAEAEETRADVEPATSLPGLGETDAQPLFAIPPADRAYLSDLEGQSQPRGSLFLWLLFVLLGAAIVVSAFLYGVHVGQSQVIVVAQPQARPAPAAQAESPAPGPASTPAAATALATGQTVSAPSSPALTSAADTPSSAGPPPTPSAPSGSLKIPGAGANPVPSAPAADEQAQQSPDGGRSQLAAAMADLDSKQGRRDSAKAVTELWSAVGSGSSDAEIILAGLYATGDGVARNCEQGRILLSAAERSGNPKAKLKLEELNARGCR